MAPTIPSGDTNTIQRRMLKDNTTGKRSSRRRHFEDSMMEMRLGRIQWGMSQKTDLLL